ncbi:hypothetical protein GGD81_001418 [Rhodobium orientis]|uniref:Virulence factor domain-containing protein n=1 Tax=Rhodobium orientis TaxID=34017 RepID=A0A327JNW8_9HYPH|nr:virulence factor [Rhodobium orientis]MBB4302391.1 hypothetical protein [Rhodobium orientis]MBK5949095.1 hypothetical protein [Rhodobium orientis]RAI26582.1 hypothetical protein CH339_13320 [Rhodobium orientis]
MAKLQIVYWRDIPAQVIAREGRKTAKRVLAERFEKAIDQCAMRSGAVDTDAYLADWRRGEAEDVAGDLEAVAGEAAAAIEADYDMERLKTLIAAGGRDSAP